MTKEQLNSRYGKIATNLVSKDTIISEDNASIYPATKDEYDMLLSDFVFPIYADTDSIIQSTEKN